jgi:superfamily II DNA or RNA helicase
MTEQLPLAAATVAPQFTTRGELAAGWLRVPGPMVEVLRDYQHRLVTDAHREVDAGHTRLLLQAPTGAGKTHVIVAIAKAAADAGLRVLGLATRTRIVRQLHDRLKAFGVSHGVLAAALPALRWDAATVQVASIDTLYRRAVVDERMPLPAADIVIFDEAHLALGDSRVAILERYPAALHFGLTATPAKISGRPLRERFDVLIKGPTVRELIAAEKLVRPRVFSTPAMTEQELAALPKDSKTGDYAVGELGRALNRPRLVGDVLQNWLRIANGKRSLLFACDKAHGAALVSEFTGAGVAAELLTDDTAEDEREAAIARLERLETTVLVNCFLMSYGVDVPSVECIVLARPTRSVTLYLQAVGRGMRPSEGKDHLTVIDHGRVVQSLGLPHEDFNWSLDDQTNVNRDARSTTDRIAGLEQQRTCPECSHTWNVAEEGPGCTACGWAPAPKAREVPVLEADLAEIGGGENSPDAEKFFTEALDWYRHRWPARWAEREKSARWWGWMQTRGTLELTAAKPPAHFWEVQPQACSVEVAGKLKSRLIAFARARRAA